MDPLIVISDFATKYRRQEPSFALRATLPNKPADFCAWKQVDNKVDNADNGCADAGKHYDDAWSKEHILLLVAFDKFMV